MWSGPTNPPPSPRPCNRRRNRRCTNTSGRECRGPARAASSCRHLACLKESGSHVSGNHADKEQIAADQLGGQGCNQRGREETRQRQRHSACDQQSEASEEEVFEVRRKQAGPALQFELVRPDQPQEPESLV